AGTETAPAGTETGVVPTGPATETIPVYPTPPAETSGGSSPVTTGPAGPDTTAPPQYSTSTIFTTTVRTITQCPPEVTNCPIRPQTVTDTIAIYTTICPITAAEGKTSTALVYPTPPANSGSGSSPSGPAGGAPPAQSSGSGSSPVTTGAPQYSTSTIYTTTVRTITQCPPEVTNCPIRPQTVTDTIAISTTICPVTATEKTPGQPGYTAPGAEPTTTTTATSYITQTFTVTRCPPGTPNCPVGSVTTTVYPNGPNGPSEIPTLVSQTVPAYTPPAVTPVAPSAPASVPPVVIAPPPASSAAAVTPVVPPYAPPPVGTAPVVPPPAGTAPAGSPVYTAPANPPAPAGTNPAGPPAGGNPGSGVPPVNGAGRVGGSLFAVIAAAVFLFHTRSGRFGYMDKASYVRISAAIELVVDASQVPQIYSVFSWSKWWCLRHDEDAA
ncbi:hypothetical protein CI102_12022, partial [Trichoderma harzianum]